jgi:hypothetical protein
MLAWRGEADTYFGRIMAQHDGNQRGLFDSRSAASSTTVRVVRALAAKPPAEASAGRPPIALGYAFVAYAVAFITLLLTSPMRESAFVAVTDALGIVPPFVAGGLSLLAARRAQGQVQTAWRFIGAACLCWGMGETIWAVYEVVLEQEPFPSAADAGYLAMIPLMAIGAALLSSRRRTLNDLVPTLDGIVLVLTFAAFLWFFVLNPIYMAGSGTVWEKAISASYPLGDLVLCYWLLVAIRRHWGFRESLVLTTLLGGMLVLIMADVGFAYLTVEDGYTAYSLVNLGWPLGFLLIGYAAALSGAWGLGFAEADTGPPRFWSDVVQLGLLPLMGILSVEAVRDHAPVTSVPLIVMLTIASLAVFARLAINLGFAEELDDSRHRLAGLLGYDEDRDAA